MNGQLFTQDFLTHGITTTPVWEQLSDAVVDAFIADVAAIYAPHKVSSSINEAITDDQIIQKVLACLAWHDASLPQINASAKRREDIPDWLLFPDEDAKAAALKESKDDRRYPHGIAILEAKRWMRPLDRGDTTDKLDPGTPSNQMLRYLSISDVASNGKVRWGILTNGAVWRLYFQGARSRSEEFL